MVFRPLRSRLLGFFFFFFHALRLEQGDKGQSTDGPGSGLQWELFPPSPTPPCADWHFHSRDSRGAHATKLYLPQFTPTTKPGSKPVAALITQLCQAANGAVTSLIQPFLLQWQKPSTGAGQINWGIPSADPSDAHREHPKAPSLPTAKSLTIQLWLISLGSCMQKLATPFLPLKLGPLQFSYFVTA